MQKSYKDLSVNELRELQQQLGEQYELAKGKRLSLDMSRGKPSPQQLDLAKELLAMDMSANYKDKNGADGRNYGELAGAADAKTLFGEILGVAPEKVIAAGNSSLNLMFDVIQRAWVRGLPDSERPWSAEPAAKFVCLVPGYDRHFAVTEYFGIEMVTVALEVDGPDMDALESLVASDASIKGMWCVPVFSNPTGAVYSAETVERLANMKTAATDFLIMWDNSYCLHSLSGELPEIPDILAACERAGAPNRAIVFTSTSKVTLAGAGISCLAANDELRKSMLCAMGIQTIGYDKINQLRHVWYLKNLDHTKQIMAKHAEILAPKFALVDSILHEQLDGANIASWTKPGGGYFISFDALPQTAKRVWQLCADAGVKLTNAGATFPYSDDPADANIRLAPSFPPLGELEAAAHLFALCVKIAAVERLLAGNK